MERHKGMLRRIANWLLTQIDPASQEANATGLRWEIRRETKEHRKNGWIAGTGIGERFFQYFCQQCDTELTPGPSGGGTNQVCESCRINYGCLPGALER